MINSKEKVKERVVKGSLPCFLLPCSTVFPAGLVTRCAGLVTTDKVQVYLERGVPYHTEEREEVDTIPNGMWYSHDLQLGAHP